jgi:16S rRNA (guanine1207-N2)-methyltransferase
MTLRLAHALETGALTLPPGRIAVFAPPAGTDLSALGSVQVVTGFRPDHDHFAERGYDCVRLPTGAFAAALVIAPRARPAARGLVARAAALVPAGLLVVEGSKTDGIDALIREIRGVAGAGTVLPKAHGKVAWWSAPPAFPGWAEAAAPRRTGDWLTVPGAFSSDGPDPGSVALAAALPPLKGRVADIGAGWGFLSAQVLAQSPAVTEMHLVEADADALDCARENVTDLRARFHWADALRPMPGAPFDAIVMNPPFHRGRAADPGLGRRFLQAAAASLTPGGTLWLVANRHLPYETALTEAFVEVEDRTGTPAFKIIRAYRPRRRA